MRLVCVPGRTVRHWATGRVIDAAGVTYDPLCTTTAHYLAMGDLALVDDTPAPATKSGGNAAPAVSE